MKISFFIFVSSGGRGGHFHSLNHITKQLSIVNELELDIVTIGAESSDVLNNNPLFKTHLQYTRSTFFSCYYKLINYLKESKPDIVHFFDAHSFNVYFPISSFFKSKVVINKCGGPNPKYYYPIVPNMILFSEENKMWFKNKTQYKNTHINVIPNRVSNVKTKNYELYTKNENDFNIVRICRIGTTYYNSILNGINLIKKLNQLGYNNIKLYIIGKVLGDDEFMNLKTISEGYKIEFITQDLYTSEASKMLYLADVVIGTGRSAMEAFSLGIPVLVPSEQSNYPILVNKDNFQCFYKKNFTHRAKLNGITDDSVLRNIKDIIDKKEVYNAHSNFSRKMFMEYFDIVKIPMKYTKFYKETKSSGFNYISLKTNSKGFLSTTFRMLSNRL